MVGLTKFLPGWHNEVCVVLKATTARVRCEKVSKVPARVDREGTMSIIRTCAPGLLKKILPQEQEPLAAGSSSSSQGAPTPAPGQVAPTPGTGAAEDQVVENLAAAQAKAQQVFGMNSTMDGAYA